MLRQPRSIRRSVSDSAFQSLGRFVVMRKRLDYGNTTPAGLPVSQLRRLQSVFNAVARLIHRFSRYEHFTPILRDFQWLRSSERVDFKLAMLDYRCLHGLAPRYLFDYIEHVADSNRRYLWSSSLQLVIRRTRLSTVGHRAFPVAGAASGTVCRETSSQL